MKSSLDKTGPTPHCAVLPAGTVETSAAGDTSLRTLLLAVDGSAGSLAATRYAARYAAFLGSARTIVLHVGQPADVEPADVAVSPAVEQLKAAGVTCARRIERGGDPAQRIVALASEADEIIIGRTGVSSTRELFVGSVAHKVLRAASCPVTVVPRDYELPSDGMRSHRILLAADGSMHAMRAVDYVCSLATAHRGIEVELINVVGPIPPSYLWESITPERLQHYYDQAGNHALFRARAALVAAGVSFNKHVVSGHAVTHLFDAAVSLDCTRIVMGTTGLGSLAGLALGSVAYRAVHLAPVPVTVVI